MIHNLILERGLELNSTNNDAANNQGELEHTVLISYDNTLIFYCEKNYGLVYAYQCQNVKEEVWEVAELIKAYSVASPTYGRYGQMNVVRVPERYGYYTYNGVRKFDLSKYLYNKIEYEIETVKKRVELLNTNNVLKQALRTWVELQPEGFKPYCDEESHRNTDRHEREDENRALSVLKEWDFLFLAEDEEIRSLYAEYIEKTERFYNCCQSHDR